MRNKSVIALLLFFGWLMPLCSDAQQPSGPQEQKLFDLTNQARSEHGAQPLVWDDALASAAKAHTQRMIDQRTLSHQFQGELDLPSRAGQAGAHFHEIAENVAMGGSVDTLQKEWMNSTQHRANILDPRLDHVGISVMERAGYLYATVVFDTAVATMGVDQTEQKIANLLRQRGVDPSRPADAARKDCAVDSGDVSGSRPLFVMRWEGSDLNRLPDVLEQRLRSGRYKTASVGTCGGEGTGNQGFTTYRIAVLLY
jgi:cysteine-rich secretory family protein